MSQWPMSGLNPQRHAYVSTMVTFPLQHQWTTQLRGVATAQASANREHVYVATTASLCALTLGNGQIRWEFIPEQSRAIDNGLSGGRTTPALIGERLYYVDLSGTLYCLTQEHGSLLWERSELMAAHSSPAIYHDCLLLKAKRPKPGCVCLDLDGKTRWFFESRDVVMTDRVAAKDDIVVFGDRSGLLYGLNVHTGAMVWATDIQPHIANVPPDHQIYPRGEPIIVDETIIVTAGTPRHLLGVNLQNGAVRWVHDANILMSNRACDTTNIFYTTWSSILRRLDLQHGIVVFERSLQEYGLGDAVIVSGIVVGQHYFAGFNDSRKIIAVSTIDGQLVWEYVADSGICTTPTFVNNKLIVGDGVGKLYCFEST